MGFFQTILQSIYGPEFYKKLAKTSLGSAFGYYFLLSLLLTIISTLALTLPISAGVKEFTDKLIPEVVNKYPQNLEVRIKDGKVSTNVEEPYFIKMPRQSSSAKDVENILVIDTKTPFSDDTFAKYKTIAVLTKDHFYYRDENKHEIRGNELTGISDFTVSPQVVQSGLEKIKPYFGFVTPLILVFMFFITYLGYTFGLIKVLFIALVLFLLLKLIKPALSYKESLKTTLFGITFALILEIALSLLKSTIHFEGFPFMGTLVTVIIIILNLKSTNK